MAQQQTHRAGKGPSKLERLEARITREQKRIIERAAGLRGTSVTEFVVVSAQQAATSSREVRQADRDLCRDSDWQNRTP